MAFALAAMALAQQPEVINPATRPVTRVQSCTQGGCHAATIDRKVLHGPTALGACDTCHEYVDPAVHSFELKRQGKELCAFCHIDKSGTEGPVVHKPVMEGHCTGCHDPHGSNQRRMLKMDTVPQLCTSCHKETVKGAHVHKPVGEDCTSCHFPHTAQEPKLLKLEKRALCLSCHEDVAKGLTGAKHVHDPAKGDCLQCHTPHASDVEKVLKEPVRTLCISCHQPVADVIAGASVKHGATEDARSCLNCHTPHSSERPKQLSDDPIASCLVCHQKAIKAPDGRTVAGVASVGNHALHQHGPIAEGRCEACHTLHGGSERALLIKPYSLEMQQQFSESAYALCLSCHEKDQVLGAAAPQTGFRDGVRNLHAVHVTNEDKGHGCRACHTTHSSTFEAQIAETVPFGKWDLPINFKPTPSGGSCAPGCHKQQAYDREKPFKPLPATHVAPSAPADATKPGLPARK
jgi:predicted CXXCH cytochrome family protein